MFAGVEALAAQAGKPRLFVAGAFLGHRATPHREHPQADVGGLIMPMSKAINAEEIQRELVRCRKKRDQLIDQIHSLEQQIWPLQDELRNVTARFDQLAELANREPSAS
jgi:hypothetical protein